ncbi:MAG: class I SAM-dependent methyltransferase [Richelia sp. RM2_1_2]|nr:class I SAM-dependent methyltransferase [Richelia sp. SM1_7_0]NJN09978.1 class I SAM-dependent methyltransferase [Richelia sp. RM1_1_1]NJO30400.1 class I SAM-dependent methyltransferase [Richelia sp. SL_2_1]NJO62126.1 class I SAM-dependent methyltransferase [Richelia sp. RM2_1_2]
MNRNHRLDFFNYLRFAAIIFIMLFGLLFYPINAAFANTSTDIYQQKAASSDGIGKIYMGREISQVMGHQGAMWLERPTRETQEQPSKIASALDLKDTDIVADIGAGTGYMSFRIAPRVSDGKVFAVDIQPEMLDIIKFYQKETNITNVEPILATPTNPNLPAKSVDLALMVDAYHEFEYPQEVMQGVVKSLKPRGKAVLVEYRGENPFLAIKRLHKMTQKQVKKEMKAVGLTWIETKELLPQQHLMIFEKGVS